MKILSKSLLCFVLFLLTHAANSQVLISLLLGDKLNSDGLEFGLEGGFNFANISNMESDKMLGNFNLGFYFDIRMKNNLYFYTGVLVKSNLGVNNLALSELPFLKADTIANVEGDYSHRLNYFLVPALAKYRFPNRIYVEAGPQFGLLYKNHVKFISNTDDVETEVRQFTDVDLNKLDVGGVIGAGYKLREKGGMTLGLKYYQGFVNVYKERSGTKNQSLFIKLNIPIGAGKAEI